MEFLEAIAEGMPTRSAAAIAHRFCYPTPTFPQWLDVGHGGSYPRGDMPESRIDDLNSEQLRARSER
jgi:hypothetical protein